MQLYACIAVVLTILVQVRSTRITLDDNAQELCKKYKMMCKTGKVCAVQHFDWPNNITIPVCIPLSFVPVQNMYCQLPPDIGRCHARYIRWYFNVAAQECTHFRYGGCEGNQNNFRTKPECEQTCMATPAIRLYDSHSEIVQPSEVSSSIYEQPKRQEYETLNSIMDQAPPTSYDRFQMTRHHRINRVRTEDANNSRTRRRRDKEKEKEKERKRKDRERKRERKRLRRMKKKELKKQKKRDQKNKEKKEKKKKDGAVSPNETLQDDEAVVVKRHNNKNKEVKEVVKQTKEIVTTGIDTQRDRRRKERRRERKRLKRRERRKRVLEKERKRLEKEAKLESDKDNDDDDDDERKAGELDATIAAKMFAKLDQGKDISDETERVTSSST